jgi:hypothetical protein
MGKDKTGKSLEEIVGRIQQMMDPQSVVTYRQRIRNRLNNLREFDVVIRGQFGGYPMLGVIECKDWADKVAHQRWTHLSSRALIFTPICG